MGLEEDLEKLKKNLEIVVPADGLVEKLTQSRLTGIPLRVKLGFDPTAPDLHLGHSIVLKKIREFQECGHQVVIIIGDFTASIGDPTGRNKTRPPLTREVIQENAKTYLDQLSKIVAVSEVEVHFNSEWFDTMSMGEVIHLLSKITLSQILQREDFSTRYGSNIPISFHELIYPIIQGYDSLMIDADVEIGGTDQLFNCLVGRDIQSAYGKKQQIVACLPLLKGLDGQKKMSKSLKNYVGLDDDPCEMYGKLMSIPDSLLEEYVQLVSSFSSEEIKKINTMLSNASTNPMDVKKMLALNVVSQFHGAASGIDASEHFYKQVQSRDEEIIEYTPISLQDLGISPSGLTLLTLCSSLLPDKSKGELRRLIGGGGVTINSEKLLDPLISIESVAADNFKIKLGKRKYFLVLVK